MTTPIKQDDEWWARQRQAADIEAKLSGFRYKWYEPLEMWFPLALPLGFLFGILMGIYG